MRAINVVRFLALLFVALALAPSLAHLLELPNKIGLSRDDYLTVQQIYRGWAWLGVVVFGALASTLVQAAMESRRRLVVAAFLCLVMTQAIFWILTYPVNEATANWTIAPVNWEGLRWRWEYSHAVAAGFNLAALMALIASLLRREPPAEETAAPPPVRTRAEDLDLVL